ncbi:MAG: ABC transporter ATP-binding protein [Proteobacteria bacterium SG_bin7]|nr:MAG: ABC transporter ATP-binding protein [Proteobacteria bacterium SG_bin7]
MNKAIIRTEGLYKSYPQASGRLEILKNISINISKGESVCIVGSSGAGKSTLLHLIGALDRPTSGKIFFNEKILQDYSDDELASLRNEKMGFVFQFHHLLAEFTALENVMIPAQIKGLSQVEAKEKAATLLNQIGMSHRLTHYPSELSGGECQRVAIARALVNNPEVLFADEPTGNLDTHNGRIIEDLFFNLRQKYGLTLIVVTHNTQFSTRFQRVIRLKDGISV